MSFDFSTPIQFLKGVGPQFAKRLEVRGIRTIQNLIEFYPRGYEDRRAARQIASLVSGEIVSLKASVVSIKSIPMGQSRRRIFDLFIRDGSGMVRCRFFRVPFRGYFDQFRPGCQVRVVGKVTQFRGGVEFHHPEIHLILDDEPETADAIVPIYTEAEGISQGRFHKLVHAAFEGLRESWIDRIPTSIRHNYNLISRREALEELHFPKTTSTQDLLKRRSPAHIRLIFEDFFWLELFLAARKKRLLRQPGLKMTIKDSEFELICGWMPFQLTEDQIKVLQEIRSDFASGSSMNRLVQGDVGSGKTAVAILASAIAIRAGYQVALMAPTEILADQHYRAFLKTLGPQGDRILLLNGALSARDHAAACKKIAKHEVDCIIGTHALIQEAVTFARLGFAIIDEQHRFGVDQRKQLALKGDMPHVLVMTATPIPRTLALTVYGDLAVSQIRQMPQGRLPIQTRVVYESKRTAVMQYLKEQLAKGRQAYFIYPLVEESEKVDLKDAISAHGELAEALKPFEVGLVHGRMGQAEKESVMDAFRDQKIQVLVSTTVIEVGVDVPNATLMIVEHAERFGLSQLHQIRGRVGRGTHKSVCVLMLGVAVSNEARERVSIMESTTDGFEIAEADLKMRGAGEFLGTRQSGLSGFQMASLIHDLEILEQARRAAFDLIDRDPKLERSENRLAREEIVRLHGPEAFINIG